jgi:hypothetical protein
MKLSLFMFLIQVCTLFVVCSAFKPEYTEQFGYPESDAGAVNAREMTTQLARKSYVGPPMEGKPQQPSPSPDTHAAHCASPFQKATPEEPDHHLSADYLQSKPQSGRSAMATHTCECQW